MDVAVRVIPCLDVDAERRLLCDVWICHAASAERKVSTQNNTLKGLGVIPIIDRFPGPGRL